MEKATEKAMSKRAVSPKLPMSQSPKIPRILQEVEDIEEKKFAEALTSKRLKKIEKERWGGLFIGSTQPGFRAPERFGRRI